SEQRLTVLVARLQIGTLYHEAVAGVRGQQIQLLVVRQQHADKLRTRWRAEPPGQRLALPASRRQAVGRQRVAAARRVEEYGLLIRTAAGLGQEPVPGTVGHAGAISVVPL